MTYHLSQKNNKKLTLGTTKDIAVLLWIAEQKGFLHDHKVNMDFKITPYSHRAMESMMEGKIECGILVETNIAYLGFLKPKIPIKALVSLEQRTADNVLLRHDQNRQAPPEELKGKTVGFMPRTTSHSFLLQFLQHHNISKKEIGLKPISPQTLPNALIRGEVDAISVWHPYAHNAMIAMNELGMHYTHFKNTGFYTSEVVLAAGEHAQALEGRNNKDWGSQIGVHLQRGF